MIWIDVEDLFQHFREKGRPTGIQRVEYELCRAFAAMDETREIVRFVRQKADGYETVLFSTLDAEFRFVSGVVPTKVGLSIDPVKLKPKPHGALYRALSGAVHRLPVPLLAPLTELFDHLKGAVTSAFRFMRACIDMLPGRHGAVAAAQARAANRAYRPAANAASHAVDMNQGANDFQRTAMEGDVFMLLGSPWWLGYATQVEEVLRRKKMQFAMLVFDIIPVQSPEYFTAEFARIFAAWLRDMLPLVDVVLTISQASAADIERYAAGIALTLKRPPQPIPMGTGFADPPPVPRAGDADDGAPGEAIRLPAPGSYALIVSTIEARKNHVLLFRVWRRLLQEMPRDSVPTLVFAGRLGWLVDDLMAQLRNSNFLNGKVVIIEQPTDGEVEALYRGCLFTVFPSLYEGWGLPVTESLGYGCPCVISNAASLPEAGGTLARYFDPEDATEAYQVIRSVIEEPDGLAAWRDRIAREFQPVSWEESARAILASLGAGAVRPTGAAPQS